MLDLPKEEISKLSNSRVLLSLSLANGALIFPTFQFDGVEMCGNYISLFQQFPAHWGSWDIACWFYKWNDFLRDFPLNLMEDKATHEKIRLVIDMETSLALVI